MAKHILLVDDEIQLLRNLKEGLEPFSHLFRTDICFSVDEAIARVKHQLYDLILFDLRMPGKSGIDLCMYLRQTGFKGKVMVMTAYGNDENLEKIKQMGVLDVISKPFSIKSFRNMMLNIFGKKEPPGVSFHSVDILTVMQVINMERKTAEIEIVQNHQHGHIHFQEGEIINADLDEFRGAEAVEKIIWMENPSISVHSPRSSVKKEIDTPFLEMMMEFMRIMDERKRGERGTAAAEVFEVEEKTDKLKRMVREFEDMTKDVRGIGIFDDQGRVMAGAGDIAGQPLSVFGPGVQEIFTAAARMVEAAGYDPVGQIEVHTAQGVFIDLCWGDGDHPFHLFLFVEKSGNLAMVRKEADQFVQKAREVFP